MPNIYKFAELSKPMQDNLLMYISEHFSKQRTINYNVTAYGLKQHFTGLVKSAEHVTEECFTEAMILSGFKTRPAKVAKTKSCFNVYVLKKPRKIN